MSIKWKKKVSKQDKKRKAIQQIKNKIFLTQRLIFNFPQKESLKNDLKRFEEDLKILTKEVI